jgi:phage/plasmid-like protein (TIGR03299 family)
MTNTADVNADFDAQRSAQIQGLQDIRADYQTRVAEFESGEAQARMDAELAQRVADGKIRMVSPDRYEVLTGWDRNEYFRVQTARAPGELRLIQPESELDEVDGIAQGMFDRPEWHRLGNVIEGGTANIDEVLAASGLDFDVLQRPAKFTADDGIDRYVPGQFVNYRSDNFTPLGVVGQLYTPFQNRDGFAFLQQVRDDEQARFASAFPLNGGRRCVISMELPNGLYIDADGINDAITLYLCWFNNHDGQGKLECKVTPYRPRCGNTERLASKNAVASWGVRHTRNGLERAEEARRNLNLAGSFIETFAAEQETLAHTAAASADLESLCDEIWALDAEPSKRAVSTQQGRKDQIMDSWGTYSKELGRTAYAAERVFTDWFDHAAPRRADGDKMAAARATAALLGADDDKKNTVHRQLLTLTNR